MEDSFSINDRKGDVQTFSPPLVQPQPVGTVSMVEYWQGQSVSIPATGLKTSAMQPGTAAKVRPKAPFSNLSEREKAETYFDLYDRNQNLQKSHHDLELELKQLTTKLMKIERDFKAEKGLTEAYTGTKVTPVTQNEVEGLRRENAEMKGRLNTLTKAVRDGSLKKSKHSLVGPLYPPKQDHPRVLPSSTSDPVHAEELVLIEKLRTQVLILEKELQRYRSKDTLSIPPKVTQTINQSHLQMTDLERSLRTMEENFQANKMFYEQTKRELEETRIALATEKAKTSDLEVRIRVANLGSQGADDMARKIDELTRENRSLEDQIKELCASPFIKEAGDRVMNRSKVLGFEQEIKAKADTVAKLTDLAKKLETEVKKLKEDLTRVTMERDKNKEECMRAVVMLEERERHSNPLDAQFNALKGGADNSEFEKAMRLMNLRGGEDPAWNRLDFLERARMIPDDVPTLKREVERLRLEKSQLIGELEKTQRVLTLKNEIEKDQRSTKLNEMEQVRMQLKAAQQRTEELARLADFRANRLIQLEKNMRLNVYDDASRVIASKTEIRLGDLGEGVEFVSGDAETEVGSGENIFDLWLGESEYYPLPLSQVLGSSPEASLVSFLAVDFYNHETQVTNICEGLKPAYNIHISFRITADDGFLQFLEKGFVMTEAVATKEQTHVTLGHGKIALVELIRKAAVENLMNSTGAVIEGVCTLLSVFDSKTTLGIFKYKMRMRHPLSEALRWYKEREEIVSIGHPQAFLLEKVSTLEEKPETQKRTLKVYIERCSSLTIIPQPGLPSQPALFISYQLPGMEPVVSATKTGVDPIFDETRLLDVPVTNDFQRFLDTGSLEILVFDDNVIVKGQDLVGQAKVPLSNLLLDLPVEGSYTLFGKDGRPAGVIGLSIIWQDVRGPEAASTADILVKDIWQRIGANLKTRGLTVESAFNVFDQDQDGLISGQEFRNTLLITLRVQISEQEIQTILNLSATSNGAVSKTEFRDKLQSMLPLGGRTQEVGAWEEAVLDKVRAVIRNKNLTLKAAFDAFDINSSGMIEFEEFKRTLTIMQLSLSDEEILRVFAYFDSSPNAKISFQRFMERMLVDSSTKPAASNPQEILQKVALLIKESKMQLRQAFGVFDANQDGKISRAEFLKVFEMMKMGLSPAETESVWTSLKKDDQGFLIYSDFCAIFEVSKDSGTARPSFSALRQRIVTIFKTKGIKARTLLTSYDRDRDGFLRREEFREALESLRINLTTYEIEVLLDTADRYHDGRVSINEWCDQMEPRTSAMEAFRALFHSSKMTQADVFDGFDRNKDGFVSNAEFREAMVKLDLGLTMAEIEELARTVDTDKDGRLNYREFLKLLQPPVSAPSIPTPADSSIKRPSDPDPLKDIVTAIVQSKISLRKAFDVFDKNGDGRISGEEFIAVLNSMQLKLSPVQISQLMARIDTSKDGNVSYEEFRKLFQSYGVQLNEDGAGPPGAQTSLPRKK